MKYALAVYGGPFTHQASSSAYQFAKAAIARGHEIYRVFFYHDGVYNGSNLSIAPQDEVNVTEQWKALADTHKLDLVICIAAAIRRGVINESEANRYEKDAHNLDPGFEISGLGQLVEAAIDCDRLITFGE